MDLESESELESGGVGKIMPTRTLFRSWTVLSTDDNFDWTIISILQKTLEGRKVYKRSSRDVL